MTTESLWLGTLSSTILTFIIMSFIHLLVNKYTKNYLLKNYSYLGMVFVSIIGSNIQYLSFRCFSQLYQMVPVGIGYNLNLVFCYIVLLLIIIYSVTGVVLFKTVYNKANFEYILEDLFGQEWLSWFVISNLSKMLTGFIHAYFYYNSFVQTLLLTIVYIVKTGVYSSSIINVQGRFEYTFELISYYLFSILQIIFLTELFLMHDN